MLSYKMSDMILHIYIYRFFYTKDVTKYNIYKVNMKNSTLLYSNFFAPISKLNSDIDSAMVGDALRNPINYHFSNQ